MLLWLLRSAFVALLIGMAVISVGFFVEAEQPLNMVLVPLTILALGGLVLFTDVREKQKQITTLSAVYFGLLLGLLLGWLFSMALVPILESTFPHKPQMVLLGRICLTILCCYVTISTLLQTKDEFRFIIPYVEFSKQVKGGRPLVLDTSVIIDGRVADICETGFMDGTLVIPQFVLRELQQVADSADSLKRNRGRRGLDILQKIRKTSGLDITVSEVDFPDVKEVDLKIIELAKSLNGKIVTNDFNLNKVAQLRGVQVLNINELANALKPVVLPGEFMRVFILKEGKEYSQGVAYLDDGTMVVVDNARKSIGKNVDITVTSVLQTTAGKMIFGKAIEQPQPTPTPAGEARKR
jgi:uncharacterized protein YacL